MIHSQFGAILVRAAEIWGDYLICREIRNFGEAALIPRVYRFSTMGNLLAKPVFKNLHKIEPVHIHAFFLWKF